MGKKMKHIMISIRPEWVEKILNGEKTLEIRKTMPKCELPCKVYIYCTKNKKLEYVGCKNGKNYVYPLNGKVVAEFILKKVECFTTDYRRDIEQTTKLLEKAKVDFIDAMEYETNSSCLYAWDIDNLEIYDEPKELSKFGLKRPFQSWGYLKDEI